MKGRFDLRRIRHVADHCAALAELVLKSRDGLAIDIEGEHAMTRLGQRSRAGQPDA
jgi:hypothetical protein